METEELIDHLLRRADEEEMAGRLSTCLLLDQAISRLRELSQAQQWRPIETAPKDGTKVIGHYKNHIGKSRRVMMRWFEPGDFDDYIGDPPTEGGWYEDSETHCEELLPVEHPPTHWMPLPPAPKGGEG